MMAGYTAFQTDQYTQAGQLAFQQNAFQIFFFGIAGDPGPDIVRQKQYPKVKKDKKSKAPDIEDVVDRMTARSIKP